VARDRDQVIRRPPFEGGRRGGVRGLERGFSLVLSSAAESRPFRTSDADLRSGKSTR